VRVMWAAFLGDRSLWIIAGSQIVICPSLSVFRLDALVHPLHSLAVGYLKVRLFVQTQA